MFDPSDIELYYEAFHRQDWESIEFGLLSEEILLDAPKSHGMGFTMLAYVDSDHAGEVITRRYRTGFILYLINIPIYWVSRK